MQCEAHFNNDMRTKSLWKFYLDCSYVNGRYDMEKPSFTLNFELFCTSSNLGVSGFSCRILLTFENEINVN